MQFIRRSVTSISRKSLAAQTWIQNLNADKTKMWYSLSTDRITVTKNSDTGIAELKMHNPPVNCMTYQSFEESIDAIKNLERDNCRALIISSAIPNIFCAGWDLKEIRQRKPENFENYLKLFENFIIAVYSAKFATISAINGVALGGGCILTLASDYRVILQTGSTGLIEIQNGFPLGLWIYQLCANVTGARNAELASLTGETFKADKALKIGMVDEVATDTSDLMQKALAQAKIYANLPDIESWYITKMEGRNPTVDLIEKRPINAAFRKIMSQLFKEVDSPVQSRLKNIKQ